MTWFGRAVATMLLLVLCGRASFPTRVKPRMPTCVSCDSCLLDVDTQVHDTDNERIMAMITGISQYCVDESELIDLVLGHLSSDNARLMCHALQQQQQQQQQQQHPLSPVHTYYLRLALAEVLSTPQERLEQVSAALKHPYHLSSIIAIIPPCMPRGAVLKTMEEVASGARVAVVSGKIERWRVAGQHTLSMELPWLSISQLSSRHTLLLPASPYVPLSTRHTLHAQGVRVVSLYAADHARSATLAATLPTSWGQPWCLDEAAALYMDCPTRAVVAHVGVAPVTQSLTLYTVAGDRVALEHALVAAMQSWLHAPFANIHITLLKELEMTPRQLQIIRTLSSSTAGRVLTISRLFDSPTQTGNDNGEPASPFLTLARELQTIVLSSSSSSSAAADGSGSVSGGGGGPISRPVLAIPQREHMCVLPPSSVLTKPRELQAALMQVLHKEDQPYLRLSGDIICGITRRFLSSMSTRFSPGYAMDTAGTTLGEYLHYLYGPEMPPLDNVYFQNSVSPQAIRSLDGPSMAIYKLLRTHTSATSTSQDGSPVQCTGATPPGTTTTTTANDDDNDDDDAAAAATAAVPQPPTGTGSSTPSGTAGLHVIVPIRSQEDTDLVDEHVQHWESLWTSDPACHMNVDGGTGVVPLSLTYVHSQDISLDTSAINHGTGGASSSSSPSTTTTTTSTLILPSWSGNEDISAALLHQWHDLVSGHKPQRHLLWTDVDVRLTGSLMSSICRQLTSTSPSTTLTVYRSDSVTLGSRIHTQLEFGVGAALLASELPYGHRLSVGAAQGAGVGGDLRYSKWKQSLGADAVDIYPPDIPSSSSSLSRWRPQFLRRWKDEGQHEDALTVPRSCLGLPVYHASDLTMLSPAPTQGSTCIQAIKTALRYADSWNSFYTLWSPSVLAHAWQADAALVYYPYPQVTMRDPPRQRPVCQAQRWMAWCRDLRPS